MISLKNYSSFHSNTQAQDLITINEKDDILRLIKNGKLAKYENYMILGGGSNVVFTKNFDGLILHNKLSGKKILEENNTTLLIKISSGENWNQLVERSIQNDLAGIENLIMIPGTVGGAPVQNIGAYGVEISETLVEVEGIDLTTGKTILYANEECEFGYRDSIFKSTLKQNFFITSITLRLTKVDRSYNPRIHYADVDTVLYTQGRDGSRQLHPQDIAHAVSTLRKTKLPDPKDIGTVGSFFKNPIVNKKTYLTLKNQFPSIKGFPQGENKIKLSAGQLIDLCGLKGYRDGSVGTYKHHALVLVNYEDTTPGAEIADFIKLLQDRVYKKFRIKLIPEVNIR